MVNEKINKTPEQLLDEALVHVKKEWYEHKSIVGKFKKFHKYRQEIQNEKQKYELVRAQKMEELRKKESATFDYINPRDPLSIKDWLKYFKYKNSMSKAMLINMELTNGDHKHFIAYPQKEQFEYEGKLYVIDPSAKYYDHSAKMYCADYHEDFVLPIIRRIPLEKLREALRSTGITDIENACNPSTLKQFIESEIIQKVMKGQEFEDMLRSLKMMLIIALVIGAVHLVLFIAKSGILQSIHIPGLF